MRLFVLIALLFCGCKIDSDKAIDKEKFTFKTGDDTELFFKNVRQSYYDLEENKAAKFNVFRFSDRVKSSEQPILNLAIVINYMQDEAYLLLEPNPFLSDLDKLEVIATDSNNNSQDTIRLTAFNHPSMLEFSASIYEALIANKQLKIKVNNTFEPVLDSKVEREAFRITISDYFRLTRVY